MYFGRQVPTVSSNLQSQIFGIDEISEKCIAVTEPLSHYQSTQCHILIIILVPGVPHQLKSYDHSCVHFFTMTFASVKI